VGTRNFVTDALGSTLALADATGNLPTQYTFEPFGNTTIAGSSTTNSFAYTGRELDATGLYFYRARYYNPQLNRFISEDPIGLTGGINIYAYVGNRPTTFVDPLGYDACPNVKRQIAGSAGGVVKTWLDFGHEGPILGPPGNPIKEPKAWKDWWDLYKTSKDFRKIVKCSKKLGDDLGKGINDAMNSIGGGCQSQ